jgi:hypothetical protein
MIHHIEQKVTNIHNTTNIQTNIGWHKIIRGKISKQLLSSIIPIMKKENTHIKFILKLITFIVTQIKKTWIYRIHQLEKEESNISYQVIQQQNITKLTFLYKHSNISVTSYKYTYSNHIHKSIPG